MAVPRNALLACMLLCAAGEPQVSAVDHINFPAAPAAVVVEGRCDDEIVLGIRDRCHGFETVVDLGQHRDASQCRVLEIAAEGCAAALISIWSGLDAADRSRCGPGVTHVAGIVSSRVNYSRSAGECAHAPGGPARAPAHQTNTTTGGTGWDSTSAPASTVATGGGAAPAIDVAAPGPGPSSSTYGEN